MNPSDFKERYKKAETIGDLDNILDSMPIHILRDLCESLEVVGAYTDLDMRQKVLISELRYRIKGSDKKS